MCDFTMSEIVIMLMIDSKKTVKQVVLIHSKT